MNSSNLEICVNYKDANGNQYYIGDLVFNPFFGDIWLIDKYSEKEMKEYKTECPYCLKLWTSADQYVMDLDEPEGFVILKHKNEDGYSELYNECLEVLKKYKEMVKNENSKEDIKNDS